MVCDKRKYRIQNITTFLRFIGCYNENVCTQRRDFIYVKHAQVLSIDVCQDYLTRYIPTRTLLELIKSPYHQNNNLVFHPTLPKDLHSTGLAAKQKSGRFLTHEKNR